MKVLQFVGCLDSCHLMHSLGMYVWHVEMYVFLYMTMFQL